MESVDYHHPQERLHTLQFNQDYPPGYPKIAPL